MGLLRKCIVTLFFTLLIYLFYSTSGSFAPFDLPTYDKPFQLYFTELQAPLRSVLVDAIRSAKSSILLIGYQLRDEKILDAIREMSEKGIYTYVIVDESGYKGGRKGLGKHTFLVKRTSTGIMHDKILVIDKNTVYLGSTNFTYESFNLHSNDLIGLFSPSLAEKIWMRAKKMDKRGKIEIGFPIHGKVDNRSLELWFTPNPDAIKRLSQLIDRAEKTIRVAMYTFTHPELAEKLVKAKERGVKVTVVSDYQQSKKVNQNALTTLIDASIPVFEFKGIGLFHHKFALIDDITLVVGSLNWTKAAFTQNDDCFMIISQLTGDDQADLNKIWDQILYKTKGLEYEVRTSRVWENGKNHFFYSALPWSLYLIDHSPFNWKHTPARVPHPRRRSLH